MTNSKTILCLMGPTASGKTRLAIQLAQHLSCEIISVDSAMVYCGMDIGTAKPSPEELKIVPHHLIDICDPTENYSAGRFCMDATREIENILQQGKTPLLVGGTMLYFYLLQEGIASLPKANPNFRKHIDQEALQLGWAHMHEQLSLLDPIAAQRIHPNDSQRIQRALEIYYATGTPSSKLHRQQKKISPYRFINLILAPKDRAILHERIATRFKIMLKHGLVDEVKQLYQRWDLHVNLPSIRTVGYRQVWSYLDGEYDYHVMVEKGIVATRQLAKRQLTWLRRWKDALWFDSDEGQLLSRILYLYQHSTTRNNF